MFDQVFAAYCKAAALTMQFQQEMFRQWANQWFRQWANQWSMATAAQRRLPERSTEVMNEQREALDAQFKSGTRMIEDATRTNEAATNPRRRGDAEVRIVAARGTPPPPVAPAAAETAAPPPRTGEGATIQLHAEELHPHKQFVEAGEIRVRKEVVTEHRTIEVPVQREEIVIERHAPAGASVSASDLRPGEELHIALREERVTVEKRPVVKEEVRVGKRVVQGTERVGGEVRTEEVRIEREGDVDIHNHVNGESST